MTKVSLYAMVVNILVAVVTVVAVGSTEQTLTCTSQRCNCTGPNASAVACYFTNENFYLTTGIADQIQNVSIRGKNVSIIIKDKTYDDSWSTIKHFEVDGLEGNVSLHLPSYFTNKLNQTEIFRLRSISQLTFATAVFSTMTHLKHLDLSGSRFRKTEYQSNITLVGTENLLHGLTGFSSRILESLNLSSVYFSNTYRTYNVLERLLKSVSSVKHLDLSYTRAYISFASFEYLHELVSLNITGTQEHPFASCMEMLVQLQRLEVLRMDDWPASSRIELPKTIQTFNYGISSHVINHWNCSSYNHTQDEYYLLPTKLKELHLRNTKANKLFIDLQRDVCIHSELEYLSVRQLDISGPIGAITGLHNLRSLDISSLQMPSNSKRGPFSIELFHDMPSLESVTASNDVLYKIEKTHEFEDLFQNNENMKFVDLRQNGLHALPYNFFSGNRFIEKIDLSLNRMEYLSLNLSICLHLQSLSVEHNNLQMIEASTLVHSDLIQRQSNKPVRVFAKENRLKCDCKTILFVTWIQKHVVENEELTCETEEGKAYIKEFDMTNLEHNCKDQTSTSTPNSSSKVASIFQYIFGGLVGVLLTFASITILFFYVRKKMGMRKLRNSDDVPLQERTCSDENEREDETMVSNRNTTAIDNIYYIGLNESLFKTDDRDPHFAAFLAYSHVDRDFVLSKLYDPLQKQLQESFPRWNKKLLTVLYDKNFLPGQCTMDVCRAAVYSSYVTVAIISDAFTRSTWCHYEIETAIEARVPIIPVYIAGVDTGDFPAILKYIYEHKVRVFWPKPETSESTELSIAELSVIRDLSFSVSTYIKQQI